MSDTADNLVTVFIMTTPANRGKVAEMTAFHNMLKQKYGLVNSLSMKTLGVIQGDVKASVIPAIRAEDQVMAVNASSDFSAI